MVTREALFKCHSDYLLSSPAAVLEAVTEVQQDHYFFVYVPIICADSIL